MHCQATLNGKAEGSDSLLISILAVEQARLMAGPVFRVHGVMVLKSALALLAGPGTSGR
jgi:hypothetical protein